MKIGGGAAHRSGVGGVTGMGDVSRGGGASFTPC